MSDQRRTEATERPRTSLDEDEIITACDYPGEAAEMLAAHRGCSFGEALAIVQVLWERGNV